LVAVTVFSQDRSDGMTDFNDMGKLYGLEAVKLAIDAAAAPQPESAGCDSKGSTDTGKARTRDTFAIQPIVQMTCAAQIKPEAIK
jgi:hypothetical protein